MSHIGIARPLHPSGKALLNSAKDIRVAYINETSEESLAAKIMEADAAPLRNQTVSTQAVALGPKIKIMSRHGAGYDKADVGALNKRGVARTICNGVSSTTVAEHAPMMMFAANRHILRGDSSVRPGPCEWRNKLETRDDQGKNLLLVGYGRIGRHTCRMIGVDEMKVRAHHSHRQRSGLQGDGAADWRKVSYGRLLSCSASLTAASR